MKIKEIGFVAIPITDTSRARKFYGGVLGLQVSDEMMGGKWIEYTVVITRSRLRTSARRGSRQIKGQVPRWSGKLRRSD